MQYLNTVGVRLKAYCLLSMGLLSIIGCEGERFDKDKPFAIKVHSYRRPQDAVKAMERLEAKELEPYLQSYNLPDGGRWHGIFLGAFDELEDMIREKMVYEDEYGLQKIERTNFHKIAAIAMPFPDEIKNSLAAAAPLPSLPEPLPSLLQSMPNIPYMKVESFQALWLATQPNVMGIKELSKLKIDFPRGVTPKHLYQNADGLCMAEYKDEITGKSTQLIVVQLKESHPYGDSPAERFAESILGTRRYELEKMEPIASANASGYTVSIVPRPGQTKNYLVLYNTSTNVLYLGESRDKQYSLNDWQILADKIIPDASLWHNSGVLQELLMPLPSAGERLAYFNGRRVGEEEARVSSWLKGNLEGRVIFVGKDREHTWDGTINAFSHPDNAKAFYQRQSGKEYKGFKSDSINIDARPAQLLSRRVRTGWRKYAYTPKRIISHISDHYVIDFDFSKMELSTEDMQGRIKGFGWEPVPPNPQ